jgi:hypothetical protein
VTDDDDAPPEEGRRSKRSSLFSPSAEQELSDPELRERMRTLDPTERKWGFGVAGLALVFSLLVIPSLLHNTTRAVSQTFNRAKCLREGDVWSATTKTCSKLYHPADFVLVFVLLIVVGCVLLFAVWRSMRALTIFTAIFVGLAATLVTGVIGIAAIGYGAWLLMRSWRLQRYGAKDSKTVRRVATERADERREAKRAAKQSPSGSVPSKTSVTPSKRYTPKSKPRRK